MVVNRTQVEKVTAASQSKSSNVALDLLHRLHSALSALGAHSPTLMVDTAVPKKEDLRGPPAWVMEGGEGKRGGGRRRREGWWDERRGGGNTGGGGGG
jgi:hypothetical protein